MDVGGSSGRVDMNYDKNKVDECTLALMYLVFHNDGIATRAWKGFDWDTLDRLYEKGLISDPKKKARSVMVTPEGEAKAKELFHKLFVNDSE